MNAMKPAITVKDLYVSYHGAEALRNINFSLDQGMMAGIIGPNGAGKSTLLKSMLQLIPKDKGDVRLLGKPLKDVRKQIAYVPQRNDMDWTFPINVLDTVILGTYPELGLFRRPKNAIKTGRITVLRKSGWLHMPSVRSANCQADSSSAFFARALAQKQSCSVLTNRSSVLM